MARSGAAKWPSFVLDSCSVLGGDPQTALHVAAAVECVVAAADVVDDMVDDDWDAAAGDPSRALNGSLALNWLAHRCLEPVAKAIDARRVWLIGGILALGVLGACAGEDLDLAFESNIDVDEQQALDMTFRKSGSLVGMACQAGAAIATDNSRVLSLVGAFGRKVGVVAQLLNDMGDVQPGVHTRGTDLHRRKKTLPVAYALRCARDEGIDSILSWYQRPAAHARDVDREHELAQSIAALGGLHYTWIVADVHRRQALETLQQLEETSGCSSVRELRRLVPRLPARRPDKDALE